MAIQELMAVGPGQRDLGWLRAGLQDAIQLEFSTIPPYLCAMWSIEDSQHPFYQILREVMMEEMLHMGIACNLLAGIGGWPRLYDPAFLPDYPCPLPGGVHPGLLVNLVGFSPQLVADVFMEIERPAHAPVPIETEAVTYATIGEFYDAILATFHSAGPAALDPDRQLEEDSTGLKKYLSLDDVDGAIGTIKHQGEGTEQSAFEEPTGDVLAHYYRFQQIRDGKRIVKGADGKAKFGEPLAPPAVVYPMAPVPRGGHPADVGKPFDEKFTAMLRALQAAWGTGAPDERDAQLDTAIKAMRKLKAPAVALMQTPLPSGGGNYGPSFRLLS
jgi:Ferritin-like